MLRSSHCFISGFTWRTCPPGNHERRSVAQHTTVTDAPPQPKVEQVIIRLLRVDHLRQQTRQLKLYCPKNLKQK